MEASLMIALHGLFLIFIVIAFSIQTENRTVAEFVKLGFSIAMILFGAVGIGALVALREHSSEDYWVRPMLWSVGIGSSLVSIASGIGIWRNRP